MGNVESIQPYLDPIHKSVVVHRAPAEAFDVFAGRIGEWWPLHQFSLHQSEAATCGIEPHVGGQVYEVAKDGTRATWGTVLAWDPPRRLVMSWHPGRESDTAQEVEVRFVAIAEGTRVELEHRHWTRLGAAAEESKKSYQGGWATVFDRCYAEACA